MHAAASVLRDAYGVEGDLSPLHGERDLNFRVDGPDGRRYLLKIHNPADGMAVVEMRTEAIAHIGRVDPTLPVAAVLPAADGAMATAVTAEDARVSLVQLFEFLDGRHAGREELGAGTLRDWGRAVARLGRALRGYFHPAARYPIQWDLALTPGLRTQLDRVDEDARARVLDVLERFDRRVAPVFRSLRAQVIHNDLTRENLLVDDSGSIVGITDFGDMTHTALVCDLAVAISDVLDGRPDSLEMAEEMIAGHIELTPLESIEADLLADLVAARCAIAVVVAGSRAPDHPAPTEFPGALQFLEIIDRAGPDAVMRRFSAAASRGVHASVGSLRQTVRDDASLLAARRRVMGPLELSYDEPLHLVRGEGVRLFDSAGRSYLDAYNNVPVVGHCHPAVVAAIAAQSGRLVTNTRYLHDTSVELAERLLWTMPEGLDRVLFVNSGSEANDVAWRIARHATGRDGAVVTSFAYHGVTEATTDLSPEGWPPGYRPERIALVAPPIGGEHTGAGEHVGHAVSELARRGHGLAALLVDAAFTSDGVRGPAHDWLLESAAAARRAGGVAVADEVQAGYGRCGESLWSFAPSGLVPDFVTLGKPMGNGFPVAALLGRSELVDPFMEETGYFSTFGGNTLACAAALAVLDVIESEGIVEKAAEVGSHLRARLDELASSFPALGAVRGWGLLFGVDVVDAGGGPDRKAATAIVNGLRRRGVLVGTTGPSGATLKIRPPLVLAVGEADEIADRLAEVISSD
jgi:4-aminobutyrate aminotransferase-like enzyme/Ser/Thr protein kinase RdoA (MazF antagonist)